MLALVNSFMLCSLTCQFDIGSPFLISTTLLIVLYWQRILRQVRSKKFGLTGFKQIRVPAIVLISLGVIIEVIVIILRLTGTFAAFGIVIMALVQCIILAALAIWYSISAVKILRSLSCLCLHSLNME